MFYFPCILLYCPSCGIEVVGSLPKPVILQCQIDCEQTEIKAVGLKKVITWLEAGQGTIGSLPSNDAAVETH